MTEPRIYMRHARALRGGRITCTPGMRAWCELHRIDIRKFASEGYPGEDALRIGDAFSMKLLELARTEAASDGR